VHRMLLAIGGAVMAVVSLGGCGGAGAKVGDLTGGPTVGAAPPTAMYWPLAIGNTWRLRVTQYGVAPGWSPMFVGLVPAGLLAAGTQSTHREIHRITGRVSVNGQTWFVDKTTVEGTTCRVLLRHGPGGFLVKAPASAPRCYFLKTPLTEGNAWPARSRHSTFQIAGVDRTVTVPAGTFGDCIAVAETSEEEPGATWTRWYAGGIGPAKAEVRDGETLVVLWELLAYDLASAGSGAGPAT